MVLKKGTRRIKLIKSSSGSKVEIQWVSDVNEKLDGKWRPRYHNIQHRSLSPSLYFHFYI